MIGRRTILAALPLLPRIVQADERQPFDAVLSDGARERVIGEVSLDRFGHMALLSAVPDRSEWLRRVVNEANSADVMHTDVASRTGSPPLTNASRIIKRTDPDFTPALKDYLRTYYGLELRPR